MKWFRFEEEEKEKKEVEENHSIVHFFVKAILYTLLAPVYVIVFLVLLTLIL